MLLYAFYIIVQWRANISHWFIRTLSNSLCYVITSQQYTYVMLYYNIDQFAVAHCPLAVGYWLWDLGLRSLGDMWDCKTATPCPRFYSNEPGYYHYYYAQPNSIFQKIIYYAQPNSIFQNLKFYFSKSKIIFTKSQHPIHLPLQHPRPLNKTLAKK